MVPNLMGSGIQGALYGEATGQPMQADPAESCRRNFPTTDDMLKDAGALNDRSGGSEYFRDQVAQKIRTDLPFDGRELSKQEQKWDQALDKHITPKLQESGYTSEQIANVKTACMLEMASGRPEKEIAFAGIHTQLGYVVIKLPHDRAAPQSK